MAQKFPGPWRLGESRMEDAAGTVLLWGNRLGEVAMLPEVEQRILAIPRMMELLAKLAADPDGFAKFEAMEFLRQLGVYE
jgi:hypothetical protein